MHKHTPFFHLENILHLSEQQQQLEKSRNCGGGIYYNPIQPNPNTSILILVEIYFLWFSCGINVNLMLAVVWWHRCWWFGAGNIGGEVMLVVVVWRRDVVWWWTTNTPAPHHITGGGVVLVILVVVVWRRDGALEARKPKPAPPKDSLTIDPRPHQPPTQHTSPR